MNPDMKLREGISLPQEKDYQLMDRWMPITPQKPIPARPIPVSVDRYGVPVGRAHWQELAGFPSGHMEETPDYNTVVLNSRPIGQFQNEGYYGSKTSVAERHQMINRIANSYCYTQAHYNENVGWRNNQLANLLPSGNAAVRTSANRIPIRSTSNVNQPPYLNLHSQVNNWWDSNSCATSNVNQPLHLNLHSQVNNRWDSNYSLLLHNQVHHSGSNLLPNLNSFRQTEQYGFPVMYQAKCKQNSPPSVETTPASSATTTLPFPPVKPYQLKKQENNQLSTGVNLLMAESSNKEKGKQENVVTSTGIEPIQNNNEFLQNALSPIISAPLEETVDSQVGNRTGIDLNKTPQRKPPRRRKIRPKVAREGKPKRTPKAKTPEDKKEKPGRKRKYECGKGSEEPAMQKIDTMINTATIDPSVGPVAKSSRRALNFDLEKNGDGSQDKLIGQQAGMQQLYKRTLNVDFQTTELNRTNGECGPQLSMLIHQQNGLTIQNKHQRTVTVNQISGYMPMHERQAVAASVPLRTDLHMENPHVIAKKVDARIANPFKESIRNGYTTIQQHASAKETGHTIFQAKANVEHLEGARELMSQSNLQSAVKVMSNPKEARGSKREYSHTTEQTQLHVVNITDSSFLSRILPNRDKCYRNACKQDADCVETHKKTKIDELHTIITAKPSGISTGKGGSRQAQVKTVNEVKENGFLLQANYDMMNSHFRSSNIDDREKGDWTANSTPSGHNLLKDNSSVNRSCTVNMGESNSLATVHAFESSITSNICHPLPPTPPSKAPAAGNRLSPKIWCANVSVEQNQKFASAKSVPSEMDQGQLEEGEALFYSQQYSARKGGLAIPKIYPIPMDEIICRFKNLHVNGIANQVKDQMQNAIVPYKQDGTVVPYEGLGFIKKRKPRPKVDLDPESNRIWNLLMGKEGNEGVEEPNKEKKKWWEAERKVFKGRADSFIARMHLVQGDRRFSKWKGSVVDSVIGVFLTQNVSDHLSSSAFMSLAARFPLKPNKRKNKDGTNILVEEPEICALSPNDTIEWHEQVVSHLLNSQSFITPYEPTEYQKEGEATGLDRTGILEGHSHGLEEEIILSQDSFCSSILQSNGGIQSCSGSNSEVEDSPPGFKLDNGSTNFLQVGNVTLFQDFYNCTNESTQFQERHCSQQLENIQDLQQDPSLDSLDNLESSLTFTQLLNFDNPQNQEPLVPTFNYLSRTNAYSKLLGPEGSEIYSGECISTWPSITSEFPNAKVGNYSGAGHLVEDADETTVQQNGPPRPKEMPTVSSNVLLKKYVMQQQNVLQARSHSECNEPYCDIYQHEKKRNFDCQSLSLREPLHHSEALAKEQINITQPLPGGPQLVEKNFDVGKRISEANKPSVDKSIDPNSGKQELPAEKAYAETSPKISKSKKGKADTEKKNPTDWESLRRQVQSHQEKERSEDTMDSLDYEALRHASVKEISDAIKERGMNNMLAERIKEFLNRLVKDHRSIDLEWLRDLSPDKAKDYLLSIRGLGLKSVECVRLLTLHHLAFPVDTNVGRIAVRLGWVPLQPLPESLQLHLLELYPVLESIQKYLWPRLCKLDQRTLYELHYQLITFGKVFCTKTKPNCNACPMRGECRHFASAFASARLALPGPDEKSIVSSIMPTTAERSPDVVINPMPLPSPEKNSLKEARREIGKCEPIIEEPATPEQEHTEILESDIEDAFCEDPDEIPTIKLNIEEFTVNLQNYMQKNMELQECDMSKALVALSPEAASIPAPKLKNMSRLRTEHQVYELPDSHPLIEGMDRREPDDPSPYLLALWTPGETANSIQPPASRCKPQESGKLCNDKTCLSCSSIREANSQIVRGTLLIPCRTAMRGSFPLNGTYFQVNEVFADHESSLNPIDVPREWIWNLPRRMVYFGTSVSTIFKGLSTEGIQHCFWKGFVCVRGFDQKSRAPRPLMARLHFPASKLAKAKNENRP